MPKNTTRSRNSKTSGASGKRRPPSSKGASSSHRKPSRKNPSSTSSSASREANVSQKEVQVSPNASKNNKQRRVVNAESVDREFEELLQLITEQIENLRTNSDKKVTGIKFLRSVSKRVKTLRADTARVCRTERRTRRTTNTQSGFMKPVRISPEMARFIGVNPNELRSRVDVTKAICHYIKAKDGSHNRDLQNPNNRREIIPDAKLSKLLGYDPKRHSPLTYYSLQRLIQNHFTKVEDEGNSSRGKRAVAAANSNESADEDSEEDFTD